MEKLASSKMNGNPLVQLLDVFWLFWFTKYRAKSVFTDYVSQNVKHATFNYISCYDGDYNFKNLSHRAYVMRLESE